MSLAFVLAVALFMTIEKCYDSVATAKVILDLMRELDVQAMSKVLIGTMQLITNFAKVLNIPFSAEFRALLNFLSFFRFEQPRGAVALLRPRGVRPRAAPPRASRAAHSER